MRYRIFSADGTTLGEAEGKGRGAMRLAQASDGVTMEVNDDGTSTFRRDGDHGAKSLEDALAAGWVRQVRARRGRPPAKRDLSPEQERALSRLFRGPGTRPPDARPPTPRGVERWSPPPDEET
ncbi:MAG TPA: hypothetical protein VFQ39_18325 [Longimicrobium sp.]|nr:hypothetical protein [Longimicrobium sp.]